MGACRKRNPQGKPKNQKVLIGEKSILLERLKSGPLHLLDDGFQGATPKDRFDRPRGKEHELGRHLRFPIPKEHGAWATLYAPCISVVLIFGSLKASLLLFLVALTALFLSHEPLSRLLRLDTKPSSRKRVAYWRNWLLFYLALGTLSGVLLVWVSRLWTLLPLGIALFGLLVLHTWLVGRRRDRTVWGEMLGVVGLTASAPVTYYVLTSQIDQGALFLWFLNLVYFSSGIFYVKMRITRHVGRDEASLRTVQCTVYHALLLLALSVALVKESLPLLVILAFLPLVTRAFWGLLARPASLSLRRIGFTELALTVLYVVLIAAGLSETWGIGGGTG